MATIHKLTKDGATIFPATITDAVVHPQTGKTLTSMIKDYNVSELFPTEGIDGGNKYNLALAIQVLGTHLSAAQKTGGIKLTFISSVSPYPEEEYYLGKSQWSATASDWDQRFEVGDVIADPSGSWTPGTAEAYIDQQVATVTGNLASETLARQTADQSLQNQINAEATTRANVDNTKADKATTLAGYGITNAYTKTEVNDLVDTPHQNYVTVQTYSALPATGSADTIYRVSSYDGSVPEVNVTKYSEYAWSTSLSQYIFLCVKSQIDEVFDITVYHSNTTYSDLASALGTDGVNIPPTLRRGGMSVKYVQTSDNKYVQYFLTKDEWSASVGDWVNIEEEVSQLGQQLNLLGFPYYYINGWMTAGGYIEQTPNNDNYKILICPIDINKSYMYYSGIFSQAGNGGVCGYYDETLTPLWSYNITYAQWVDISTIPAGTKYFCAAIKFASQWTDAQMNACCFIEKNKWFTYLEELASVLKTDLATTAESISSPSALTSKISQSLYELSYSYINKIGVVGRYYKGFVATGGSYSFIDNSGYKTIVLKVEPKVHYKLFISSANNAAYNCGDYAFHSGEALDGTTKLLSSEGNPKDKWLSLIAPDNAKYLIVCVEFNNTGDYRQSCVIEENAWVKKIGDFADNTINAFDYVSKNLFNEQYDNGFVNTGGTFTETPSEGNRYLTTKLIEIKPNTYYYLQGREGAFECASYEEDGTTPHPLLRLDGTEYPGSDKYFLFENGSAPLANGGFLTPSSAKYVRFTIRFNNSPDDYAFKVMLEEVGEFYPTNFTPSSYIGFKLEGKIKNDALPLVNSILRGKKIAYNGDSFCESRFTGFAKNGGAYAYLISQAVGGTYSNRAVSGECLSAVNGSGGIVNDVSNMPDDADLICFEGGINDWGLNHPLGTLTQGDFSGEYDINTITGALETIFYTAINKWVGKPICFVIFHKVDTAMVTAMAGTCYTVHDRLVEVCKKWSIPYYDAFEKSGLNGAISAQNNAFLNGGSNTHPDGWHPDVEGYRRYYVPQLIKLFESLIMVNY